MHRLMLPAKTLLVCFLASCIVFTGQVAAEFKVLGETTVKRDKMVRLEAVGHADGAALVWDVVSGEDQVDIEDYDNKFRLTAPPGTYILKVRAFYIGKDGRTKIETARVTIKITEAGPGPGPGPDPVPPPPPPPPPPPETVFEKAVREAYASETASDKATLKTKLADIYRVGSKLAKENKSLTKWVQLFDGMEETARGLGVSGKLMETQKVLQAHIRSRCPKDRDAALDDVGRSQASMVFDEIAIALDRVGPQPARQRMTQK